MIKTIFILFATLLIASCKDSGHWSKAPFSLVDGKSGKVEELVSQKIKQLGIDSLNQGFDSIQIRVWYDYSLVRIREMILLEYSNEKWTGSYYKMKVDWDPMEYTETITNKSIENIEPKSGWNHFLNTLSNLNITSLTNMEEIAGLNDNWDDGTSYTIEIAIGRKYRTYRYHQPHEFKNNFWEAAKMVEILDLISTELGVPN